MRLFMTPAGEEAWYAALVRNVRMQITRFEIGVLDIYALSGAKQGGQSISQFRTNNYYPDWAPDYNALLANDTIAFAGDTSNIGYWRVQQNDGGLVIRIPANAGEMDIGNVRIYAKNTGPYPYAVPGAQAYKRYEEVYDDEHGGEVMLFAGFASIADSHWREETAFPQLVDIRLSIHADGMFNVLDRSQFAFEQVVNVYEADTEADLHTTAANAYGCAVVAAHSKTGLPAVFYRAHGAKQWVGYPLNETFSAMLETPKPVADINLDSGLLDRGVLDPPAITINTPQGVVVSSQPRKLLLPNLAFTKKDVVSWTLTTSPQTLSLLPNTGQPYIATVRTADLAFLGIDQQLFLLHNGTRYRLAAQGRAYNTPPIIFRDGDTLALEGTLRGPISSLSGSVYADLNEAPISVDVDNTTTWLLGDVDMHITSTMVDLPDRLVFGNIGRRISGVTWDERTPEMYVNGLGYDMYGIPIQEPVTIRVVPSSAGVGGTSFHYGTGQMAGDEEVSYLKNGYTDAEGNTVIRRGVTGLAGTQLNLFVNDADLGPLSTITNPEGSINLTVKNGDRIGFRAVLLGQQANPALGLKQILPAIAIAVEGVNSQGIKWLEASFDIAATFGPDTAVPEFTAMPVVATTSPIAQTVGSSSFGDVDAVFMDTDVIDTVVTIGDPTIIYSSWFSLLTAPNPTLPTSNVPVSLFGYTISSSGTLDNNSVKVELIKFDPYGTPTPIVLLQNNAQPGGTVIPTLNSGDAYRVRVTFTKPRHRLQTKVRFQTDGGPKDLNIDTEVKDA